jgi:hypothetical protein
LKNQLVLVSEPANLKAALKQVEVHAKAIEGWMLALQWEHEHEKFREKAQQKNLCGWKVENQDSEKAFGSNSECSRMIATQNSTRSGS